MRLEEASDPGAVVAEMYALLSGPGTEDRDWARFATLFLPSARLRIAFSQAPGETVHREWTVPEFAEGAAVDYRARSGFWEQATFERLEQFGSIAHCWSVFESREGDPANAPFARGINSIQLVLTEGGWRIVHLLWDIEQPHNPIPSGYAREGPEP